MLKVIIHIDETSSIPVWAECKGLGAFSQKERDYFEKIAKFLLANPYEHGNKQTLIERAPIIDQIKHM